MCLCNTEATCSSQQQIPKTCHLENFSPLAPCLAFIVIHSGQVVKSGVQIGPDQVPEEPFWKASVVSRAVILVQELDLQIPTNQARQNQTGSSSLWRFPFCQTFQKMGDLLEKLNADIREWDNWIQVVHLVGYKTPEPCYEYCLVGKSFSPSPCVLFNQDVTSQAQLKALQR